MSTPIIKVENVNKTYGKLKAVDSLSFEVFPSTCFGFLGPNGAGKTTMMKIIYGKCVRENHKGDKVNVFGYDPRTNELDIKYLSGVVQQENNLDQELNVIQNLHIYSKFYNMPQNEASERINYLLDFLELSGKRDSIIKELSGGMKRRLIIARALIHKPRLLILDEPTTGLDPQVRHLIWEKLRELKEEGITILLTTHYMDEAFQLCDTVLIMDNGKKIMEGVPQNLLDDNIEKYVLETQGKDVSALLDSIEDSDIVRKDDTRERAVFYSNDPDVLKRLADNLKSGEYFIRQSNLEDLFLKITGRVLNVNQ